MSGDYNKTCLITLPPVYIHNNVNYHHDDYYLKFQPVYRSEQSSHISNEFHRYCDSKLNFDYLPFSHYKHSLKNGQPAHRATYINSLCRRRQGNFYERTLRLRMGTCEFVQNAKHMYYTCITCKMTNYLSFWINWQQTSCAWDSGTKYLVVSRGQKQNEIGYRLSKFWG